MLPFFIFSQNNKWDIFGGTAIGGPMPLKKYENSFANLKHGASTGINYTYFNLNKLSLSAEISYQYIHLNYGQSIRKDTTVQITIPLQNGNILTTNINTYYKAYINGIMKLIFFKIGNNVTYNIKKYNFSFGTYIGSFTGGYDKGTVDVTIGEGGVAGLDDIHQNFSNNSFINKYYFEVILRTEREIYKNLWGNIQFSRGITPFYSKDFTVFGEKAKFFATTIALNALYKF